MESVHAETMESDIRCSDCGTVILNALPGDDPSRREPCPNCGSNARTIPLRLESSLALRSKLGMKQKRPGCKKPILESVLGDDLFRVTNTWQTLVRVIDRLNDRYYELIRNPETGEVVRHCEEPLSQHIGRGSAKHQPHAFEHEHIAIAAYFIREKEGRIHGRDQEHWAMAIKQLKHTLAGVPPTYH